MLVSSNQCLCVCYSNEQVKSKSGPDAVHYLSFQRHLMFLLSIMTVVSLAVILPINLSGDLQGGLDITISDYSSNLHNDKCVHFIISVLSLDCDFYLVSGSVHILV